MRVGKKIEGREEEGTINFNDFINNALKTKLFFHLYLEQFHNVIFWGLFMKFSNLHSRHGKFNGNNLFT